MLLLYKLTLYLPVVIVLEVPLNLVLFLVQGNLVQWLPRFLNPLWQLFCASPSAWLVSIQFQLF